MPYMGNTRMNRRNNEWMNNLIMRPNSWTILKSSHAIWLLEHLSPLINSQTTVIMIISYAIVPWHLYERGSKKLNLLQIYNNNKHFMCRATLNTGRTQAKNNSYTSLIKLMLVILINSVTFICFIIAWVGWKNP
jgi:hypothetical protein